VTPISLATTFRQSSPGVPTARDDPNSFGLGYEYSRTGNPTRGAFERAVAAAERAEYAVAYSSGSAATSAVVHAVVGHGEHVVCVDDVYGGTQRYFRRIVTPTMGIQIDFVDMSTTDVPVRANTKLIWLETPTNPTLKITDIAQMAGIKQGAILAVDNTFCSPYFQSPLALGADLVVHSVTKYIGGHSDVVMGVVCTNSKDLYTKLRFVQNGIGAVPSPFDCYLAHRGLKTLHLRMEAAGRNAFAIALFLQSHEAVAKVLYPGLPSHPQYELAQRQQHGSGAMITFYVKGGRVQAAALLENVSSF
jgi:cystathionine gamma-lyase